MTKKGKERQTQREPTLRCRFSIHPSHSWVRFLDGDQGKVAVDEEVPEDELSHICPRRGVDDSLGEPDCAHLHAPLRNFDISSNKLIISRAT